MSPANPLAQEPCPVRHCAYTLKVHSLTPDGLYFCKCTDQEVVKVTQRPGFYGGKEKALVCSTPEEREEFCARLPRDQWPVGPNVPNKNA